ncbi:MAG TPA: Flp pilus assembly protein CpaB [Paracoccaceae bacterium]|nr:Flp pilus assembly protein CpaB [Paracoccaceae bacterium]
MRASTVLSLLIAILLAGAAVYGARSWLASQQQQFLASVSQQQQQTAAAPANLIVVAKQPMRFGEIITAEKLETIPWASSALPNGAFNSLEALVGTTEENSRFVLASMEKGEPVLTSKVTVPGQRAKLSTAIEPGMKAVSIRVNDVLGVAGFVLPGDRVDVMLTRNPQGSNAEPYVDVLLQGVKVLAIDQSVDDRKDQPSVVKTVTFEVSTEEAQKLTLGANSGTLSLALRSVASSDVVDSTRMTLSKLAVSDVSEALKAEIAEREALERAEDERRLAEQTDRLQALESAITALGSSVTGRLQSVEDNLTTRVEPVVIEKEIIVEKVVEVPKPPSEVVTVRVYRNGKQQDYEVNGTGTGE